MAASLNDRWALVTGVSAGGMGDAEVDAFLRRGVNVIATAVQTDMLDYLEKDGSKYGASVACVELDVTSSSSINTAVEQVERITGGKLDFLLNNAGYGYYVPLMDCVIEMAKKEYDVNVWGILAVTQAFFPLLRAAKGTVVNQISVAGLGGYQRPYMGIYSSSKAAASTLSNTMRVELEPFGIKVVGLMTGSVKTEFFRNMAGGRNASLPANSPYQPIKADVERAMGGSFAGDRGHSRFRVTASTIAVLLRSYGLTRTRFIRRGYMSTMIWLMYALLPTWLLDRWARQAGSLDKLKKILRVEQKR